MAVQAMACPDCGTRMDYRLGVFTCPKCGREIEAPRPGKQEKRWSVRQEPWEQKQYKEQLKKAQAHSAEPGGSAALPRATQVLGMYGDQRRPAIKEFEGYGKLMLEKHLYFFCLLGILGLAIYFLATGKLPTYSWFHRFRPEYFLFMMGWGGIIYLFFMWVIIYRQFEGLKWLLMSIQAVLIVHMLLSYIHLMIGIRYDFMEDLNHHIFHLENGQENIYLAIMVLNLWFVSILWRDVRRLRQHEV